MAETWGLRSIVFYTSLRLAGWSTGWTEELARGEYGPDVVGRGGDIARAFAFGPRARVATLESAGKVAYLASVSALYLAMLAAIAFGGTMLVLSLTAAAAAFHAVEYLAVVTHYAQRRRTQGSAGIFRAMARSWGLILAGFLILFGLLANLADAFSHDFWVGINLWAAGLHYAYDGMIWKLRTPQTAQVLDVEMPRLPAARAAMSNAMGRSVARPAEAESLASAEIR